MFFYKVFTCQKIIMTWYCVCVCVCVCVLVKKSKVINILNVKLVKNSNITKLENFNSTENNILTDKYLR